MTTDASTNDLQVTYEAAVAGFGGSDAADFLIERPSHARLECALYLAMDARHRFEARTGPLDEGQRQDLLRALAPLYYARLIAAGEDPPAIATLRARDLDDATIGAVIAEAGLPDQGAG